MFECQELEQDRYSQKMQLAHQIKCKDDALEEVETVKSCMMKEQQSVVEELEAKHGHKVDQLSNRVCCLAYLLLPVTPLVICEAAGIVC